MNEKPTDKKTSKAAVAPAAKKRSAPPVELPENSEHMNAILYGVTGAGKTFLCGTANDFIGTSPALLMDFEGGTKTLHGRNIDVTRPQNWKEIQDVYEFFLHDNTKYRCLIIDSLTELQKKQSMGNIMNEFDEGDSYSDLERASAPTRQDWLRSGEQMRKTIRAFRDLAYHSDTERRVHVIMTALERLDEKRNIICPQLPGALGLECGAMVDLLLRLSRQQREDLDEESGESAINIHRHLLTDDYIDEDGLRYMAKNRGDRLGDQMWDPTIEKILGVWKEET